LQGITIKSRKVIENCQAHQYQLSLIRDDKIYETFAPGGYKFILQNEPQPAGGKIVMLHLRRIS